MNEQIKCGESQTKMTSLRRCDSLPCKLRSIQSADVSGKHHERDKKHSKPKFSPRDNEYLNHEQIVEKWTALRLDIDKINFTRKTENNHVPNALYDKSIIKVNSISNPRGDKTSVKTKRFNTKRRVVEIEAKVNYNDLNDSSRSTIINQTFSPLESFQVVRERNADSGGIKAYTCQCNCLLEKRDKKYPTKASKSSRSLLKNWTLWSKSQDVMMPDTNINNDVRSNEVNLLNSKAYCPYKQPSNNENNTMIEQVNGSIKAEKFAERGRSKSLGYMQTKSVHQFRRCNSAAAAVGGVATLRERAALTLARRYYPEGGWGWTITAVGTCVQTLAHGLQLGGAPIARAAIQKFRCTPIQSHGWLGALSAGVALAISPLAVALCVRKSTRVTAVLGGLVTALGCLFTSFASQFHQLFFSYGTVVGIGVGLTRDCSTLMVAQYFKRRRELVEIFIVSGSGLGIALMSAFIKGAITAIGWRLGLQAVTGVVFLTFILGTFYRSASLYHPQRRAILHLKNQNKIKRKLKDRNKSDDRQPFFDFSTLRSKTVRILLMSTGISAFGVNTPIFYLAYQAEEDGLGDTAVLLQTYLGLAWTVGCMAFGMLVLQDSAECRIGRQYLCQAAVFVCGLSTMALTVVHGSYRGYVMFAWIYGIFCGGYHYSLKMYTYERVRSRNFARTWGFVQCSQAVPIAIGVPLSGYMNVGCGGNAGYYFSSTCSLLGSLTLFCIDLHKRSLAHKHSRYTLENGVASCNTACPQRRSHSHDREPRTAAGAAAALVLGAELAVPGRAGRDLLLDSVGPGSLGSPPGNPPGPELTCISEEGGLDLDLDLDIPENLLDDYDCGGDCITSCNKVENYLMLSEYENNLIAEIPTLNERRGRRWSIVVGNSSCNQNQNSHKEHPATPEHKSVKWKKNSHLPNNARLITVINEASL